MADQALGQKKDFVKIGIKIVVIAMFVYHFYIALTGVPEPLIVRPIHVAFVLFLGFLKIRASSKNKSDKIPWYDWILAISGVIAPLYILTDYRRITWRMPYFDPVMPLDTLFGALTIILVLELARRTVGKTLVVLVVVVIMYTIFGRYFPGVLYHSGVSAENLLEHLYLTSNGVFGSLTSLSQAELFMFITFGAFLQIAGGEKLFNDIAVAATKNSIGGPAKAAVIGSALFGTISGSGVANVYATGSVTIPLMKRAGYKPEFAGAVEAVASSLGQLIPPVMGASAFLIAEFSQRPYLNVAAAAVVPSLLYVYAIYMSVHFEARRLNLGKYSGGDLEVNPILETLKNYGHILVSVVILIGFLIMRRTAYYSATMAVISVVIISWVRAATRIGPKKFMEAVELSISRIVTIGATVIAAGLVVSTLQTTGTIFKITALIVQLAGGSLAVAVVLVALIVIILGMGLPPAGAFLIASVFGASALMNFGVAPFTTYIFIFMFGITAMITPPVCTASYAAASIANTSFMKTGIKGFLIGIPAYIIPFFIIYNPVLLDLFSEGAFFGVQILLSSVLGITCLVSGVSGYLLKKHNAAVRIILIINSLLLIWPETISDIIGLVVFAAIIGWQYFSIRAAPKAA